MADVEARPVGDPERGAAVFKQHCAFCHSFDPTVGHKKGPNLSGLWGRERGSVPGFKFHESEEKKCKYFYQSECYCYL